jgi:hypothetical protein
VTQVRNTRGAKADRVKTLRFSTALAEAVDKIAAAEGRSCSDVVRRLIVAGLKAEGLLPE